MTTMFIHKTLGNKQVFYHSNGSGRDQYVNYFSGGFIKDKELYVGGIYEKGSLHSQKKVTQKTSLPKIEAKYAHYFGDGTGRDQYIVANEGGMTNSPNLLAHHPKNYLLSLRHYNQIEPQPKENDFLRRTMAQRPQKWLDLQQIEFNNQKTLTKKLSSPKNIRSRFISKTKSLFQLPQQFISSSLPHPTRTGQD